MNKLLKEAEKAEWTFDIGRGGHIKCYSPDGKVISTVSVSPKSDRAVMAARNIFKKGGL